MPGFSDYVTEWLDSYGLTGKVRKYIATAANAIADDYDPDYDGMIERYARKRNSKYYGFRVAGETLPIHLSAANLRLALSLAQDIRHNF